jgi:hypothetical protein
MVAGRVEECNGEDGIAFSSFRRLSRIARLFERGLRFVYCQADHNARSC